MTDQQFAALLEELAGLRRAVERVAAFYDEAAEEAPPACLHPVEQRIPMGINSRGEDEWICRACEHHEGKE